MHEDGTHDEKGVEDLLADTVTWFSKDPDFPVADATGFAKSRPLTSAHGVTLKMDDGTEFDLAISQVQLD